MGQACAGNFDRLRLLNVTGYVRCQPDFGSQADVMNGASNLFLLALGDRGRHVRTAAGTNALPHGAPVEIATHFEILPEDVSGAA